MVMKCSRVRISILSLFIVFPLLAQEGVPLFTTDFPLEEFSQRRDAIAKAIGQNALALLQGAPGPEGYVRFRQSNEFYYVCGIEVPHAYLLIDGATRRTSLYLPNRNAARERSEGKLLSAEDEEFVKKLAGVDAVFASTMLGEHVARAARSSSPPIIYTPMAPAEGFAMSRDLALRAMADLAADPFDGRPSREGHFIQLLKTRLPALEVRNLTPILDNLRLIKSPREIALIKKATYLSGLALMEGMRSSVPGIKEHELDAAAKYIYYINGAQGEAYYSLIASGPNAMVGHYNAGKRTMQDGDWLLFDFAPDVGYYMSDLTRMWPVNGKFSATQRELYGFYLACYKAILKAIRPGVTAAVIRTEAAAEMERTLANTHFSKPLYEKAAKDFIANYKQSAQSTRASLGHWVGMSTHDVGQDSGPLRPGMVFTIEPALRVPEEQINIRLEDLIVITENGAEIVSDFVPMDIEAIEKLMKEEGMVQKYPRSTSEVR